MRSSNGILQRGWRKQVCALVALALLAGCPVKTLHKTKALYQDGKYAEVVDVLQKDKPCEKSDPVCLQTNLMLADSALRVGNLDVALTASRRASQQAESKTPEQTRALKILAETEFQIVNRSSGKEALTAAAGLAETADRLARSDPASGMGEYYRCRADSILLTPAFSKAVVTGEGKKMVLQDIDRLKARCAAIPLSDPKFSEAMRVLLLDLKNYREALSE